MGLTDVKIPQSKHEHKAPVLCIRTLRKTAGGGEGNTHTQATRHEGFGPAGPAMTTAGRTSKGETYRNSHQSLGHHCFLFSSQSYFKNVTGKQLQLNDKSVRCVTFAVSSIRLCVALVYVFHLIGQNKRIVLSALVQCSGVPMKKMCS